MSVTNASRVFSKLIGVITLFPIIGFSQGQERKIDKISWRHEPIKILKLKTKDKPIELGKNFSEEDDWLKGLTVTVQNVSDKAIARIQLHLEFPRPEGTSEKIATYVVPMGYGRDPGDPAFEHLKLVPPGETVDVKLLDANLPFIEADLKQLGYPEKITRAQIRVEYVTFIDGTMWTGDDILYPDPKDPKRKINPRSPPTKEEPPTRKPSANQLSLLSGPSTRLFHKVGFVSLDGSITLNTPTDSLRKSFSFQAPFIKCNAYYDHTATHNCGDSGSGCTYR